MKEQAKNFVQFEIDKVLLKTTSHIVRASVVCILQAAVFQFHTYKVLLFPSPLQPHALLQRVKSCISDEEEEKLMQITSLHSLNAFLLPIKTVGVQVRQLIKLHTVKEIGKDIGQKLPAYVLVSKKMYVLLTICGY